MLRIVFVECQARKLKLKLENTLNRCTLADRIQIVFAIDNLLSGVRIGGARQGCSKSSKNLKKKIGYNWLFSDIKKR